MIAERILSTFLKYLLNKTLIITPFQSSALPGPKAGHEYLLYLHVPFCESLCPYCTFNRFLFEEKTARSYFKLLREEMRMVADIGYSFSSMYIGGGTPTVLIDELVKTIDLGRELFGINEVSCETNPDHLTSEIISELKGRVQRLSVGVQSFDDQLLKQMKRYERFGSGEETFGRILSIVGDFPTLNVDMIFNFPGQTREILLQDIQKSIATGPDQITYYPLMNSPSVDQKIKHSMGNINHSNEAIYYQIIYEELKRIYTPVTVWSFSRKCDQRIDEYIVDFEEYIGIGSGSFSYLDGTLYVNCFLLPEYQRLVTTNNIPTTGIRRFSLHDQMRYCFMMELFGLGLYKSDFKERFGLPVERGLIMEMIFLQITGAFERNDKDKIRLSPKGRYLIMAMMREFFCHLNKIRDQARARCTSHEK